MSITQFEDGRQHSVAHPSLRDRKKRRTRERLHDAALQLFAERHYEAVTVDEICDRAEVGRATFFRLYGSKAGLLAEFNHRLADRIAVRLSQLDDAPPTAELWAVQEEIAAAWGSSTLATREMAREYIRNATAADSRKAAPPELLDIVAGIVRRGQASGEFTSTYDACFVAWIILASLSAVTAGWLGTIDDPSLAQGTHDSVGFLLDGLRDVGGFGA